MDPPTPLRARRPDASAELEAVIGRCLEKKPADRYQDVGALAAALAPFATERGRISAGRIGDVVRTAATTGSDAATRPSDQASLGMASTMRASPTDSAWEQKRATPASSDGLERRPVASRFRAGMLALGILVIGGAGVGGVALAKRSSVASAPPPAPPTSASLELPLVTPPPPSQVIPADPLAEEPAPDAAAPRRPTPATSVASMPALKEKSGKQAFEKRWSVDDQCRETAQRLHQFADDGTRVIQATMAKAQHCRGVVSHPCQIAICLEACGILKDEACLRETARLQPQR